MAKFTKAKKVISAITAVSVLGTAVAASSFAATETPITKDTTGQQSLTSSLSINVSEKFAEYTVSLSDFTTANYDPATTGSEKGHFEINGTASGNKGGVKLESVAATSNDPAFTSVNADNVSTGTYAPRLGGKDSADFDVCFQLVEKAPKGAHSITVTAKYSYDVEYVPSA